MTKTSFKSSHVRSSNLRLITSCSFTRSEDELDIYSDIQTCFCICLLQAAEANSVSLSSVSGGAEVSWSSEPPRPLLPPPRPGAAALLSALRPARLPGVRHPAAPWPPLPPHTWCYWSSRRPHPRAGGGAPATSHGASEGLTAEGVTYLTFQKYRILLKNKIISSLL